MCCFSLFLAILLFQRTVAQQVSVEASSESMSTVSKILDIGGGDNAWIIKDAIADNMRGMLVELLTGREDIVRYTFMYMNYSRSDPVLKWNHGSAPWVKPIDINHFKRLTVWNHLKPVVEQALNKQVKLEHGQIEMLRSLDAMLPSKSMYCAPDRFVLTLYLGPKWRRNNYGHVSFYSEMHNPNITGKSRLEITESVHPHAYRALLWPSCHMALFRAPCVNYFNHLPYINLYLTTDLKSEGISVPPSMTKCYEQEFEEFPKFTFTREEAQRDIDYEKYLTRTFYDKTEDRPIHVFDGLFTDAELRAWLSHLLHTKAYSSPYDHAPLQDHDNVQWVSSYDVDKFVQTDMWPRLQALLKFVSNESDWSPYDVALNFVRSADHTRIHPDSEPHQTEYTLLLYLSEGIKTSDYGETLWMVKRNDDGVHGFLGPGGDLYESIAAVAPKFGRMVIFRNNIEHSAHPPATLFLGGRYSFAVKVSRNARLAYVRRLYEEMEKLDLTKSLTTVSQQLQDGLHDNPKRSILTLDLLVALYKRIKKMSKGALMKQYNELREGLLKV